MSVRSFVRSARHYLLVGFAQMPLAAGCDAQILEFVRESLQEPDEHRSHPVQHLPRQRSGEPVPAGVPARGQRPGNARRAMRRAFASAWGSPQPGRAVSVHPRASDAAGPSSSRSDRQDRPDRADWPEGPDRQR